MSEPANATSLEERSFRRHKDRPSGELAAALAKAQEKFEAIEKSCTVDFTYNGRNVKYNYADLASVYSAVRKPLSANGLSLTHSIDGEELVCRLVHSSGEQVVSVVHIGKPGRDWKDFGTSVTYATRYAISGLLGVASEEDIDAPPEREKQPAKAPAKRRQPAAQPAKGPVAQAEKNAEAWSVDQARREAEACETPEKLTALAIRWKDRPSVEKMEIAKLAAARNWVWDKGKGGYVFDAPSELNPTDDQGNPVF